MRRFSATPLALSLALAATLGCGGGSHTTGPVTGTVDQTTADDLALQAVVNVDLVGGDGDATSSRTVVDRECRDAPRWAVVLAIERGAIAEVEAEEQGWQAVRDVTMEVMR